MTNQPRYTIGIDLGTTNSVLAWTEAGAPERGPRVLPVPQWESPAAVVESEILPSFNYLTTPAERQSGFAGDPRLPPPVGGWVPGLVARIRMADSPGRVIHSAKSWLSHGAVDRTAPILPWQSPDIPPEERLSPLQASAGYLAWLRQVWDAAMAAGEPAAAFEAQEVVVTVPASFDEAAQQLTLEAARLAGYPPGVRLLEEPQAAFYDWLGRQRHLRELAALLERSPARRAQILVVDIGGGTTDFSLFEATGDPQAPAGLALRRLAVSEHLLLGGDNIDLTLAYRLEERLTGGGTRLTGRQLAQLLAQARELKERILRETGEETPVEEEYAVTLAGAGAGLFAATRSARLAAAEVREIVLEGFFPACTAADRPQRRTAGFREWGLPYAADTAVTRHLAGFLEGRRIDAVLFNGGTVTPDFLRRRLHGLLAEWQGGEAPAVLGVDAPSLAVARGAARYAALLRRPQAGLRIAGGHAHALYLEVVRGKRKKVRSLVCVLPRGLEPGRVLRLGSTEFDLLVNQPVRFQCFYSFRRAGDAAGAVVPWNAEDFRPLPPLQTAIHLPPERPRPANNRVRVTLESSLSELGLLQLYCVESGNGGRWRLDFNLRRGIAEEEPVQAPEEPLVPDGQRQAAHAVIRALYGKKLTGDLPEIRPRQLVRRLEETLGGARESWDGATLRTLWPLLAEGMGRRGRTPDHEESWLYLAGYVLRPGYGFPLDETRIEEIWRLFGQGMVHPKEKRVEVQWHLLWRRVAGGLNAGRQERILEKLLPRLRGGTDLTPEMVYLAGSLERLRADRKLELVRLLAAGLERPRLKSREPYAWALGRLLARAPLYAGPDAVLPPSAVEELFLRLRGLDWRDSEFSPLNPLFAQAARLTERRDADLAEGARREILEKMRESGAHPEQVRVVREMVPVAYEERERQFGESLPAGLILLD